MVLGGEIPNWNLKSSKCVTNIQVNTLVHILQQKYIFFIK
jgi:hypothetical protein